MFTRLAIFLALLVAAWPSRLAAQGTVVWNGPVITFSNAPGSLWFQPANQDQFTANVALTRDVKMGLFNAFGEGGYSAANLSPADTEWAIGLLANYSSLTYNNWTTCYGGQFNLATTILNNPSVLHLMTDNIYVGIKFTYWGGSGGGFAYERTTLLEVPEPAAAVLVGAGFLFLLVARRNKTRHDNSYL